MPYTKKEDELLDRPAAAKYLGGNKPLNPGTLAVWDCTKRHDLKPVKVGRSVRYKKSELDKFLERQLEK
ncbi:MAG: helix-turn-helix domain-containing protein [Chitinophagaceae bacterium]